MTAFAGIVALEPGALPAGAAIDAALRRGLSRHPGETVHTATSAVAVAHYFDIDAWADGPAVRETGDGFLFVSGDPAYGEAASRQAGVDLFADHYARDPAAALAATTGTFTTLSLDPAGVTIAADKFASRPVYWARRGALLCFATSYRALRDALTQELTIDQRALREYTVAGQPLGDRTLFREIRVLLPGQMLRTAGGDCTLARYHDWSRVPPSVLDRDAALAAVHEAFMHAVRRRSYEPTADAFLSGGMDSRCVVAGLLDAGRDVHTFNTSYRGSADQVLGDEIARHFGTTHRVEARDPDQSLGYTLETFANFARRARSAFPRRDGRPADAGRLLWSGDGGSVLMGHVYLTEEMVAAMATVPVPREAIARRFGRPGSRIVRGARDPRFATQAHADIADEFDAIACSRPDRRLYLFFALNNQARHIYWTHEQTDRSRVELVTPFFDARLVETIVGLPTEWFLLHGFYNSWIGCFDAGADAVPWQVYPGHLPGPHPPRDDLHDQWRGDWHDPGALRRIHRRLAWRVLRESGRHSRRVLDFRMLALSWASLCLGIDRFGHEAGTANRLSAELDRSF